MESNDNHTTETAEPEAQQTAPAAAGDQAEQSNDQPDPAAQLAEITAERDALVMEVVKMKVAAETGVPAELLLGGSETELRAQAEKITEYVKANTPTVDYGAGSRGDVAVSDPDPARRIMRR